MKLVASFLVFLAAVEPIESARLGVLRVDTDNNVPKHRVSKEFGGSADDEDIKL